jgi:hypothetical protein
MSLQFFAPAGVQPARHKKERDDGDENRVNHRFCFQIAGLGSAAVSAAAHSANQKPVRFRALIRQSKRLRVGHPRSVPFARCIKSRSFMSAP